MTLSRLLNRHRDIVDLNEQSQGESCCCSEQQGPIERTVLRFPVGCRRELVSCRCVAVGCLGTDGSAVEFLIGSFCRGAYLFAEVCIFLQRCESFCCGARFFLQRCGSFCRGTDLLDLFFLKMQHTCSLIVFDKEVAVQRKYSTMPRNSCGNDKN